MIRKRKQPTSPAPGEARGGGYRQQLPEEVAPRRGTARLTFTVAAAAVLVALLTVAVGTRDGRAWSAGWSGGNTLVALNWDYFNPGFFPWSASSSIQYTMVWDPDYHTRIDYLTHQSKTDSDWSGQPLIGPYLTASVSTTFYSDGWYLITYGPLSGGCWVPAWDVWFCDSGSVGINVYGSASAFVDSHVAIGGGGWYTLGGESASGWYYW